MLTTDCNLHVFLNGHDMGLAVADLPKVTQFHGTIVMVICLAPRSGSGGIEIRTWMLREWLRGLVR